MPLGTTELDLPKLLWFPEKWSNAAESHQQENETTMMYCNDAFCYYKIMWT